MHWKAQVVLALAAPISGQGQLWTVGTPASDFPTIQEAVDAASDGDVVYVPGGKHAPFSVVGKSLTILGVDGAEILGTAWPPSSLELRVADLAAGQRVLLKGFGGGDQSIVLSASNCAGAVVLEDLALSCYDVQITNCADVLLVRSQVPDVEVVSSELHAWDSEIGRKDSTETGEDGLAVTSGFAYLSGCTLFGERGASAVSFPLGCEDGGPGGDALALTDSTASTLACTFLPGTGGLPSDWPCVMGPSGVQVSGSGWTELAGSAHSMVLGSPDEATFAGGALAIRLVGDGGEFVHALVSTGLAPIHVPQWKGTWVNPAGWIPVFLGVLPGNGVFEVAVPLGPLAAGVEALDLAAQAIFIHPSTLGPNFIGAPSSLLVLDPDIVLVDCNGNGVDDATDIALGTSLDADGDGYPDECESTYVVPVDHPTIQDAVDACVDGDQVLLRDGVYTGPGNVDVSVKRDVRIQSLNGPAACIVDGGPDLLFNDRLFTLGGPKSPALVGLTLRNANWGPTGAAVRYDAEGEHGRIQGCIFENDDSWDEGVVWVGHLTPDFRIVDCLFKNCAGGAGGGAVHVQSKRLRVENSVFDGNGTTSSGSFAGGLFFEPPAADGELVVENCAFLGNAGTGSSAGGLSARNAASVVVRNSIFAGNQASAARFWYVENVLVTGSTFVQNDSLGAGASIIAQHGDGRLDVENSILWGSLSGVDEVYAQQDVMVSYSLVEGGTSGILHGSSDSLTWGFGNLDVDPLFVAPGLGDFHLSALSPAKDAGFPGYSPLPGETDIDGQPRVAGPAIDMGADEVHP